jgi:predicted nucleic acid-binding protein
MKRFFVLTAFIFSVQPVVLAQKDSMKATLPLTKKTTPVKLTVEQEQWIRQNYQHIAAMKKDSAKMEIRQSFASIPEASAEFMISRAGKLLQEDKQKHKVQMQQMLQSLTSQKNALKRKLTEKERELKKTKDPNTIKILNFEINGMKNKLIEIDKEILYLRQSK